MSQAFENVIANARRFAPERTMVDVGVSADHGECRIAMARTITQSYGGAIVADNRVGGGARFEYGFPR